MYTLSDFKAKVSELVAGRTDSNSFDPTDTNTKTYAQSLVTKITESAKCETKDLFTFSTDQFIEHLATVEFNKLIADSATTEEIFESAAALISEEINPLFGLFADFKEKQDELLSILTVVAEGGGSDTGSVVAQKLETIIEGAPAAPEGADAAADTTIKEGGITLTIIAPSEKIDETPWGSVDKARIKETLKTIKEAGGEGADAAIAEVYAIVGSVDDPTTWKYPHHVIEESGAIVLNTAGLAAASNYIQSGRFTGTEEVKQSAATHLQGHYDAVKEMAGTDANTQVQESAGYPAGLDVTSKKTPGVRMVSIDLIEGESIIPFEEAAMTENGKDIAIIEACANLLHGSGQLPSIIDATLLTISPEQMTRVRESLVSIAQALMGNLPKENELIIKADTTLIEESAAKVEQLNTELSASLAENDQLKMGIELRDYKIEALSTLSEGSALEGIAESVISSKTVEQVRAFKAITENPGLKRLITAVGNTNPSAQPLDVIKESSPGTKGLENLDTIFEEDKTKTKKSGKCLAALYV